MHTKKILVICSQNKRRSLTAERMSSQNNNLEIRSAGTSPNAKHTVSTKDVEWADIILCMEYKHQDQLYRIFGKNSLPRIIVANIPDDYEYMDPELIQMLHIEIENILSI